MKKDIQKSISSHRKPNVANRIIVTVSVVCVSVLLSGLIVQSRLMNYQIQFYQEALAYCYSTDCSTTIQEDVDL